MSDTRYIVAMSGGITSAKVALDTVRAHGKNNTVLLFSDVNQEDDDLHRFNREVAEHLGVPITRVADLKERDPWDVFFDKRWLGNSRRAQCSYELKQLPAHLWLEENCDPENTVVLVGIGWNEKRRIASVLKGYAHKLGLCVDTRLCSSLFTEDGRTDGPGCRNLRDIPWKVDMPLMRPPYHDKRQLITQFRKLGIREPQMYRDGYEHNNCRGLCVKAGQAQWALTLELHPNRYAHAEAQEIRFRETIDPEATILRDWSDGGRPLTLTEFRERIERRKRQQPTLLSVLEEPPNEAVDTLDWGGCGCFVDDAA